MSLKSSNLKVHLELLGLVSMVSPRLPNSKCILRYMKSLKLLKNIFKVLQLVIPI